MYYFKLLLLLNYMNMTYEIIVPLNSVFRIKVIIFLKNKGLIN